MDEEWDKTIYEKAGSAAKALAEEGFYVREIKFSRMDTSFAGSVGKKGWGVEMRAVGFKDLNGFIIPDGLPEAEVIKRFVERANSPIGFVTRIEDDASETTN